MAQLQNFNARELLVLTGATTLGRVGITEIDTDIQQAGTHSKMNVARSHFESYVSSLSIDLDSLSQSEFSSMELALKYYALYLYQSWDLQIRRKSECSEDDYRRRGWLKQQAILALKHIGTKSNEFIQKFEDGINANASHGSKPLNVSDFVTASIVTDSHCAAKSDDLEVLFGDTKMEIDVK